MPSCSIVSYTVDSCWIRLHHKRLAPVRSSSSRSKLCCTYVVGFKPCSWAEVYMESGFHLPIKYFLLTAWASIRAWWFRLWDKPKWTHFQSQVGYQLYLVAKELKSKTQNWIFYFQMAWPKKQNIFHYYKNNTQNLKLNFCTYIIGDQL